MEGVVLKQSCCVKVILVFASWRIIILNKVNSYLFVLDKIVVKDESIPPEFVKGEEP